MKRSGFTRKGTGLPACYALCLLFLTAGYLHAGEIPARISPFANYTIFEVTDEPETPLTNDATAIEVGVKIRSSQNGVIKGIRFYKGIGTTGTHTGHLWSSTGTLLAEAVFTGETSSGWQEVLFSTPVAIAASTTYVASCLSSSGDYCYTNPYFTSAVTNGPITALANGDDGPNGLYSYSSVPVMPSSNYLSANYFVDVVFTPGEGVISVSSTANYIPKFGSATEITNSLLYDNGSVIGVGTITVTDTNYKLFVEKGVRTRKVKVDQANWPDYVFRGEYELMPLPDLEKFVHQHHHLPGVPPAGDIETNGLDLGDVQAALLKKMEEMTLYIIQLKKEMEAMKQELEEVKKKTGHPK